MKNINVCSSQCLIFKEDKEDNQDSLASSSAYTTYSLRLSGMTVKVYNNTS